MTKAQSEVSRRDFLHLLSALGGGVVGAALMRMVQIAPEPERFITAQTPPEGAGGAAAPSAAPATGGGALAAAYPRTKVASINGLKVGEPVKAAYPDDGSPIYVLKLGQPAVGGVGPDGDIVAFSRLCPHMGCTLKRFITDQNTLVCGCHYSIFDLSKGGMMVLGQATDNLPQVVLEFDEASGDVYATGVRGLLYGRLANVLSSQA